MPLGRCPASPREALLTTAQENPGQTGPSGRIVFLQVVGKVFLFLCCGRDSNLFKGYRGCSMPGEDRGSGSLFPHMNCETRTGELSTANDPRDRGRHPGSRASGDQGTCSKTGWTSIASGKPLQTLLLRAFTSICPKRQLIKQLYCNLLFRRLVGLSMDATVHLKTRDRQIEGWLAAVLQGNRVASALSAKQFAAKGTLIDAWASMKRFRPKDDADDGDTPPPSEHDAERPRSPMLYFCFWRWADFSTLCPRPSRGLRGETSAYLVVDFCAAKCRFLNAAVGASSIM